MRQELLEGGYSEPTKSRWSMPRIIPQRRFHRISIITIMMATFVYVLLVGSLAWMQSSLIYNPTEAVTLNDPDWAWKEIPGDKDADSYKAYYRQGAADKPIVVFFHGRSEGLWSIARSTAGYSRAGWTVLAPEYPGFAGLSGYPNEESINALVDAVHSQVIAMGYKPENIVIQGNSLGAGPALTMAGKPHGLLVLTAPVASMSEIVDDIVPFFPQLLLYNSWDNEKRAREASKARSMVFHAKDDSIVPYNQGERLAKILHAQFTPFDKGDHFIGTNVDDEILKRLVKSPL